ncbi:MAG: phosphogluconate dehydrogenase (NAD(+)-dependent, decarboxylating) [Chthonomonadales bacterium]
MQIGMIGLGKMGANMVQRLKNGGHSPVVFDRSAEAVSGLVEIGCTGANSLADLVSKLDAPRVVWVMVPSGAPTESTVQELFGLMSPGDVVIDGGNSNFHDSKRRAEAGAAKGIHFLDAGTSGGVWGLKNGYCLMVGGPEEAYAIAEPIFTTLAPPDGCLYTGPSGSGHFAKMVHNGIEYGMLQAYGEGFDILHSSDYTYDLQKLSHLWNQGSVVRSWLLELAELAFEREGKDLTAIQGYVEDSGEGRWTVLEAIEKNVPAPVLTLSLLSRFMSRDENNYSAKVIAALRNEFGGHAMKRDK